ncbi:MAG: hypothetical protein FWG68_10035 [Defluviitaleaceae bacterium]|nr:hypothetical protein [Defluviitaleaceae bacterium]
MKEFIQNILLRELPHMNGEEITEFFGRSPLLQYLDAKMGAIFGDSKTRRSLANIYAIYSILHFYEGEYYNQPQKYRDFGGYEYTKLFAFYRSLYGGERLQNHALNSRVNGEFRNKMRQETDLIIINDGKYALHINYLYVGEVDISKIANRIVEEYINLLIQKDNRLIADIEELLLLTSVGEKTRKISEMIDELAEARLFEIISFAILKNYYKNITVYFGYSRENLQEQPLQLYKTGRTNANDGGIDFVMRPLGRFFQVTEVANYDKYLLDMDKVMHFPITFVIKTLQPKEEIRKMLDEYIELKSGGMRIIEERYRAAIEEIITINELKAYLLELDEGTVNEILVDIDKYYRLELNLP